MIWELLSLPDATERATLLSSFQSLWSDVEPIGLDRREAGYYRITGSKSDFEMREWFVSAAQERGLDVHRDRAGNLWAWWHVDSNEIPLSPRGLVLGSHLDSVQRGGAFDGALGIVSAFAAIDELRRAGTRLRRPLGVVAFLEEEGARFGATCLGSRALMGSLRADEALALRDDDGFTLADVLSSMGMAPDKFGPDVEAVSRVGSYIELHIEQGRGLIGHGRSVGVASSINAYGRWRLDVLGEANHAGTTKLDDRHDPMFALAEVVIRARRSAENQGCLATVAKLHVEPNVSNAIPARVTAWLDARGHDESLVRAVASEVASVDQVVATQESLVAQQEFPSDVVHELSGLLDDAPILRSGAAHDAGILSAHGIPSGMVFVRNPTGISHAPEEYASPEDCVDGIRALARIVEANVLEKA